MSLIRPTDLIYDPRWPKFKLMGVSSRQTFWSISKSTEQEMWPLECPQGISLIWPSGLVYDPRWPKFKLMGVSSRQTFWSIFKSTEQEMWPLERPQGISLIWPRGLVYDPRWPKFKLIWDFIKTKILTDFQVNWARNLTSRAHTRYFFNLT